MSSSTVRSAATVGTPSLAATADANSASFFSCSTTASVIVCEVGLLQGRHATTGGHNRLDRLAGVDAGAFVAVRGDDVVEDGVDLLVEQLGGVGVEREAVGEHALDGHPDAGHRLGLSAPVEDELVVQVLEEALWRSP